MLIFVCHSPLITLTWLIITTNHSRYMLGRIANLPCLKLSHWDPLIGVQRCIDNIRRVLEVGSDVSVVFVKCSVRVWGK